MASLVTAQKQGRTQAAAQRALVESLRDRQQFRQRRAHHARHRGRVLAKAWWSEIEQGTHSPGTPRNYRDRLDRQVIPSLGQLRVRELTTGAIDRHLRAVKDKHGAGTAKLARTVLSGMCGLAAATTRSTATRCARPAPSPARARKSSPGVDRSSKLRNCGQR